VDFGKCIGKIIVLYQLTQLHPLSATDYGDGACPSSERTFDLQWKTGISESMFWKGFKIVTFSECPSCDDGS